MIEIFDAEGATISFDYVNWKGRAGKRRATIKRLVYGSNEWHPEPQFLLEAYDEDKCDDRTFAVRDIANVEIAEAGHPQLVGLLAKMRANFLTTDDFGSDDEYALYVAKTEDMIRAAFFAGAKAESEDEDEPEVTE